MADGPYWSPALPADWQRRSMQQVKWCVPLFPPFPLCQEQLAWIVDIRSDLKLPSNFSPSRQNGKYRYGRVSCLLAREWWLHCVTYLRAGREVSLLILMLFVILYTRVFNHTQISCFLELFHLHFQPREHCFQLIMWVNFTSDHVWYFKTSYLDRSWLGLCLCTTRVKLEERHVHRVCVWSTCLRCVGVRHTHFWWVSGLGMGEGPQVVGCHFPTLRVTICVTFPTLELIFCYLALHVFM